MKTDKLNSRVDSLYRFVWKNERWFFASMLLIGMLQFWIFRYVPSLDGPQHLYNSNVLIQLLKGNEIFSEFFRIKPPIVINEPLSTLVKKRT